MRVSVTSKKIKKKRIIWAITNKKKSLFGIEGDHYGFVEFESMGDETVYGYFTQQYLDRSYLYDEESQRHVDWEYKYHNILVIWPLHTHIIVIQDSKFFQAPTLNMRTTLVRILTSLRMLFESNDIRIKDDLFFTHLKEMQLGKRCYEHFLIVNNLFLALN